MVKKRARETIGYFPIIFLLSYAHIYAQAHVRIRSSTAENTRAQSKFLHSASCTEHWPTFLIFSLTSTRTGTQSYARLRVGEHQLVHTCAE